MLGVDDMVEDGCRLPRVLGRRAASVLPTPIKRRMAVSMAVSEYSDAHVLVKDYCLIISYCYFQEMWRIAEMDVEWC